MRAPWIICAITHHDDKIITQVLDQDVMETTGDLPPGTAVEPLGTATETPRRAAYRLHRLRVATNWLHRLSGASWLHTRRSKASWQAGYNAACLYAALAQQKQREKKELEDKKEKLENEKKNIQQGESRETEDIRGTNGEEKGTRKTSRLLPAQCH